MRIPPPPPPSTAAALSLSSWFLSFLLQIFSSLSSVHFLCHQLQFISVPLHHYNITTSYTCKSLSSILHPLFLLLPFMITSPPHNSRCNHNGFLLFRCLSASLTSSLTLTLTFSHSTLLLSHSPLPPPPPPPPPSPSTLQYQCRVLTSAFCSESYWGTTTPWRGRWPTTRRPSLFSSPSLWCKSWMWYAWHITAV